MESKNKISVDKIIQKKAEELTHDEWIKLICTNCQYYYPEEKEKLQCAGFEILKKLAFKKKTKLEEIVKASATLKNIKENSKQP